MSGSLDEAVAALRSGGVIAYPTEAVWGLGCDPSNEAAVTRLFSLKARPAAVGVLLIGAEFAQIAGYIAPCPAHAIDRALASWPGPHTWIFPRNDSVPRWIAGEHRGIAVRVTAHPVARALCLAFGGAIVSTSANRHGESPARSIAKVREAFPGQLDAFAPGDLGGLERPTPIRDAITGEIVRG